jgi:hypothetical protein
MALPTNENDPKDGAGLPIGPPQVNVPNNASSSLITALLSNLPSLFEFINPQKKEETNYTPYYLLGGVLLIVLLTNKK